MDTSRQRSGLCVDHPSKKALSREDGIAARPARPEHTLLGYRLGLVAWFAAHPEPAIPSVLTLFAAAALGSLAGWIPLRLPARVAGRT